MKKRPRRFVVLKKKHGRFVLAEEWDMSAFRPSTFINYSIMGPVVRTRCVYLVVGGFGGV